MDRLAIKEALLQSLGIDPAHSRILVVGLGKTGVSVALFLHRLGIRFAVVDSRRKERTLLDELLQEVPDTPVFTGGFHEAAFDVATHLVVSPGVALTERVIEHARANGARILSDIDLFACAVDRPVAAITGSNGKSTVTTMLGKMAEAAGIETAVGGNLGTPALDLLESHAELYVLELSSFQLERTSRLRAAAATVLNVTADHMDRYRDMADYARQKQKIFAGQGVMVLNADDPVVAAMREPGRRTLTFGLTEAADFYVQSIDGREWLCHAGQSLLPVQGLQVTGRHNVANALAALALGRALALPGSAMCQALREFKGLAHRMQKVAEIDGVTWINDSKATNIGACVAALQGVQKKVILIAGGDCKGADMRELAPAVQDKARAVVLLGKDAPLITQAISSAVPVYPAEDLQEAVKIAAGLANPGESVLLSPACASLDQFKNYQERGEKFIAAVRSLAA